MGFYDTQECMSGIDLTTNQCIKFKIIVFIVLVFVLALYVEGRKQSTYTRTSYRR